MPITDEGYQEREIQALFGTTTPAERWINGKGAAICFYASSIPDVSKYMGYSIHAKEGEVDFTTTETPFLFGTLSPEAKTVAEAEQEADDWFQVGGFPQFNIYLMHRSGAAFPYTNVRTIDSFTSFTRYQLGRLLLEGRTDSGDNEVAKCATTLIRNVYPDFFDYRMSEQYRIMFGLDDIEFEVDPIDGSVFMVIDIDETLPDDLIVRSVAILGQVNTDQPKYDMISQTGFDPPRMRFNATENKNTTFIDTAMRLCPSFFAQTELDSYGFPADNYQNGFWRFDVGAYEQLDDANQLRLFDYQIGQEFLSIMPAWETGGSACQLYEDSADNPTGVPRVFEWTRLAPQSLLHQTIYTPGTIYIGDTAGNEEISWFNDSRIPNDSNLVFSFYPIDGYYYFMEDVPAFEKKAGQNLRMQIKIRLHSE